MSNIVVPELGESIVDARVAKWLKKEGDHVDTGDALVELETEKVDLEVSADRPGVLRSIKRAEGADVKVGEVLAVLEAGADASASARPETPASARETDQPAPAAPPAASASARSDAEASSGETSPKRPDGREGGPVAATPSARATPTARNVAREAGVTLDSIPPSGPGGRVMKDDVLRAKAPATPAASAFARSDTQASYGETSPKRPEGREGGPSAPRTAREQRVRMSKRRATIARRLVEAQHNAAMLTTFNEVDMSAVMALRARRKEAFTRQYGVGLGIASFFVRASVGALKAFPQINAEIQGDEIVLKQYYDIGMAVGAEGGLVVPVIRDADVKSFADIELAIRDFAARAQNGSLTLEDLKGGTFTITNGGVFGSLMSTPILNPPQVGILGLHKIADRPVAVNGEVAIRPMMYLALSYDHRIVDGREAVQFLVRIKEFIEDPAWMAIG
jgi:2-oxoglutarate dehydrogenase E2 component (dihydrolipoamide succinyltransferase)